MSSLSPQKTAGLALGTSLICAFLLAFLAVKITEGFAGSKVPPTIEQSMLLHWPSPGLSPKLTANTAIEMGHNAHGFHAGHHHHGHHHAHAGQSLQQQIEHDRRHHGKPGAEVQLHGRQSFTLVAGQAKTVTLNLESDNTTDNLHVVVRPSAGLSLLSATQEWHWDLKTRQQLAIPLDVMAYEDGEHHMHVFITQYNEAGQISTRALAGAFRVGTEEQIMHFSKSEQLHKPGQAYRSMPAVETIY